MASLSLSLLGDFQVQLNGTDPGAFRTSKAQALLIYLAVERSRAHRRETLFTLFWPGMRWG